MSLTPRPAGVTVAFILILTVGVVDLLAGIVLVAGSSLIPSAHAAGLELGSGALITLAVFGIVTGLLSIIFAVGILRGSRSARLVVTVLQILGFGYSVVDQIARNTAIWMTLIDLLIAAAIIALLWAGERTRRFFARG